MIGPTRFERKIIAAIAAVAFVPFFAALLLGRTALHEAYQVGVNRRVRNQLEHGLDVYREHFRELRAEANRTSFAVSRDYELRDAVARADAPAMRAAIERLLDVYDNIAQIELLGAGDVVLAAGARADRLDEATHRLLSFERPLDAAHRLRMTASTSAAPFQDYQRAGELAQVYIQLERETTYVSSSYLFFYLAFLLGVIVIAVAVGIVASRRVTRRIALLADATARVGAGDLSVVLPIEAADEVGELTRAFNEMVLDLRETRSRVAYLQRISAWQEFARRLAHEIKNPLTPIQLAIQEVQRSYSGDDTQYRGKVDEATRIIEEEVATLRRLVSEFSAFAKLPEARLDTADLADFVRDAVKSLSAMAQDERDAVPIEFALDLPATRIPVRIDAMMLKRCLDNLVSNAVQAIHSSDKTHGRVVIAVTATGSEAVLEVRDDGPGIRLEDRARVFDAYFTTKSEGTGLGLAIVKKVVLEHGGEVECEASPEGGAAFRLRLPLAGQQRGRARRNTTLS